MHSSKGEIPIAYIIALVLGVIVLGLLGWWLFAGGQGWNSMADESVCRSKLDYYCLNWKINSYDITKQPNGQKFSDSCDTVNLDKLQYYAPDCCTYGWAYDQAITQASCES